jgi:Flp pilus assembly protein TadG
MQSVRSEEGQALVEFALVVPVLLLVLLAIVDFGKAINYWNDENYIANLGARYASVGNLPTTGACSGSPGTNPLVAYLQCEAGLDSSELQSGAAVGKPGVAAGGIQVCVNAPTNAKGAPVQVQVRAPYNWLPLPSPIGSATTQISQTTLTGSATMRLETTIPGSWINSQSAGGC